MSFLFVYGTLLKNMGNDHLLYKAQFLGSAMTCDKYEMYLADHIIPKVVMSQPRSNIIGEVYLVSDEDMQAIDLLEKKYKKTKVSVICQDKNIYTAIMYYFETVDDKNHTILPDGDYANYINN